MELHEALTQISAIRQQMARSEQFRGYRAAPVALSGVLAFAGGWLQSHWIAAPHEHLNQYLTLWTAVAAASLAICMADVWRRYRHTTGLLYQETTHVALGQFVPCVAVGGLLTLVIARSAPQLAWMLPSLWALVFSLGVFASWRWLPRSILAVAVYFLAGGLCVLSLGRDEAFSPWTMPLLFGGGQLLNAAVLSLSESQRPGATP